jgi:hypothetical protein
MQRLGAGSSVPASPADSLSVAAVDAATPPRAPAAASWSRSAIRSWLVSVSTPTRRGRLWSPRHGADIVNLGCSGAGFTITGDCGDDYAGLVQQAIALHPAVVLIQSSDNDSGASQDDIDASTRATVDELRAALPDAQLIGIATLWHLDWDEPDAIGWSSDALQRAVADDDGVSLSANLCEADRSCCSGTANTRTATGRSSSATPWRQRWTMRESSCERSVLAEQLLNLGEIGFARRRRGGAESEARAGRGARGAAASPAFSAARLAGFPDREPAATSACRACWTRRACRPSDPCRGCWAHRRARRSSSSSPPARSAARAG